VMAGAWTGGQPAANMTWFEAAAFVNWLNTSTGHHAAYNLTPIPPDVFGNTWSMTLWSSEEAWDPGRGNLYRHKDAYYVLPSEDEWYKAAYHKNDGVTANYWDYATAGNSIPTPVASGTGAGTAVYAGQSTPAPVQISGGLSGYSTRGQNGNVREWVESASDGLDNSPFENRVLRGGAYNLPASFETEMRSSGRATSPPAGLSSASPTIGFRVVSVPEPSCAMLMIGGGFVALSRRPFYCRRT
jgi:formylglycine-generating enzyme required for sulfatase activity